VLLRGSYGAGRLLVLAIPDNPGDLYNLPAEALAIIRDQLSPALPVHITGPSGVCLFVYDNGVFIAESFLDHEVEIQLVASQPWPELIDVTNKRRIEPVQYDIPGERWGERLVRNAFPVTLPAHSYCLFRAPEG